MRRFSVVIPVRNEWEFLPRTLPSWYRLNPEEVILCFDKLGHGKTMRIAKAIAEKHGMLDSTMF